MDAILLGWIATSYLLSAAVFMVPFGKIADIYGMKKVFFIGLFIFTASSLIAFFAPTSSILIGSRILQGIGSAMIFGTGTAILVSVFPVQERGKILGINAASVYLGLSLGPFLGGLLTVSGNGGDHAPVLSPVPFKREGGLCRLFCSMHPGDFCLAGEREIEKRRTGIKGIPASVKCNSNA